MSTPTSTGIGAPGNAPAPANLGRSPMSSQPGNAQAAIPFTRGSTLATMKDASVTFTAGQTQQIGLQTNAFLESLILDVSMTGFTGTAAVYTYDAPFNALASVKLDDPAGQSIVSPITGFGLYLLNKYLPDTDCSFDPCRDPGYAVPTSGNFQFRLVVPVEHRKRDAFGALNNSAANQRYLLTIQANASFGANGSAIDPNYIYSTAPSGGTGTLNINVYQQYWTSPPSVIQTSSGSTAVQATPAGLGSVAFVRYERHNEVSGGGSPLIQLNNVGDYISSLIWVLRSTISSVANQRGVNSTYWPTEFDFWVNDFQTQALSLNDLTRWTARFYGLFAGETQSPTAGGLDYGVFPQFQLVSLFDEAVNFGPANQYIPTDATTKLQVRGSTWPSNTSGYLEVYSRLVRPVSGAALFA